MQKVCYNVKDNAERRGGGPGGSMKTGIYEFAGRRVEITSLFDAIHGLCRDYASEGEPDFRLSITGADIEFEREKSAREDEIEGIPQRHFSDEYLETLAVYRKIAGEMLDRDTLLMHGSTIAVDGEGYLFTAKSGTGKSTHTRFWREAFGDRAMMVNDDKPLLRIGAEETRVFGTPWDGKHHLSTNTSVPLKAICILERGEENEICRVEPGQVLPLLLQQCHRPRDPRSLAKVLGLLDQMTKNVKFYRLRCNLDPRAATIAFEGMQK